MLIFCPGKKSILQNRRNKVCCYAVSLMEDLWTSYIPTHLTLKPTVCGRFEWETLRMLMPSNRGWFCIGSSLNLGSDSHDFNAISCFCYPKISTGLCRLFMGPTSPPTLQLSAWMSFSSMLEADCHNRQEEDHDVMLGKLTDHSLIISSSTLALQYYLFIYIQITMCICWMLLVSINCLTHVLVVKGSTVWKGSGIHIK